MSSNSHQFPGLPPLDGGDEEVTGTTSRRPWPPSPSTVKAEGYVPGRPAEPWTQSQTTATPDVNFSQPTGVHAAVSSATGSWSAISAMMQRHGQSGALDLDAEDDLPPEDDAWASDGDFLEICRAEYDRIYGELRELRLLVKQASKDLEQFTHRKVLTAAKVRELEERLETHSRQEIRTAYLEAAESEMRAYMMGEQRDQLRSKLRTYGQYAGFLQRAIVMLQPPAFERSTLLPPGASTWRLPDAAPATPSLYQTPTPPAVSASWPVLPDLPPTLQPSPSQQALIPAPVPAPVTAVTLGELPAGSEVLVARIIQAQEAIRRRVAQRLHEGPAQSLANVVLAAEICERLVGSDPSRAAGELASLKGRVNATLRETRGFIDELLPPTLEELGLVATLRRYAGSAAARYDVQVLVNLPSAEPRMARDREVAFFRVAQEAIMNAIERGHAKSVQVTLQVARDAVGLTVEDNGMGFDVEQALATARRRQTTGLTSMQERAEVLGGWLKIESTSGSGTRIELAAPR